MSRQRGTCCIAGGRPVGLVQVLPARASVVYGPTRPRRERTTGYTEGGIESSPRRTPKADSDVRSARRWREFRLLESADRKLAESIRRHHLSVQSVTTRR